MENSKHKTLTEALHENNSPLSEMIAESLDDHRLNEMALISDKLDNLGAKIQVYGEEDDDGTKTPHFHVEGEKFIFEVHIKHIHELKIWRTKKIDKIRNKNTWKERADIRKKILKWLDLPNRDQPEYKNASIIVIEWNRQNPNHRITQSYMD